ncbi:hypothetical protein N4T57_06685 [Campylobacter hepaticus]|uniref:Transmembrane protein n=1 Tax=Campylobacter hepaticus TaxID=1813019 RepID=A0A6A7JQJ6_9BACT|nr:hypothetical protein [Campylobacter hepaticus]AXP09447.1 hypothetical protein A2J15_007275 [Campylobacter hepaticus]MCZ0772806.1 hypothetical protein [Campylobacter hepaticus]MCZ0774275.1 hypothetical protein [Campylobacter hepaticus]MCZ0775527.1 hypothetical protein [Campylobacter hepaticus]MPV54190.1 hypothetical protein [Campylobacter hepaticus]
MRLLVLFLCILPLYSVELVSYNIYDRNDRVDLMLSFDGVYNGKISQKKENNFILLTFSDLKYLKDEFKELHSRLVDKVKIDSKNNNTYIMLQSKQNINIESSFINDKFGIRIRITGQEKTDATNLTPIMNLDHEIPKTKNTSLQGYDYTNYILVISVLLILCIALWRFKRTIAYKHNTGFKNFNIIFQRFLDKNNQFIVFIYDNKRYVMVVGSSNVLLESDEISKDQIENYFTKKKEVNFDSFFEENKKRIKNLTEQYQKNKES